MTRDEFIGRFESVCDFIDSLGSDRRRSFKEQMLASYQDSEFLKQILFYTYNPHFIYGINEKTFHNYALFESLTLQKFETLIDLLEYLKVNNTGTDINKATAMSFIASLENDWLQNHAKNILLRDLRCGVNIETINKVFPKLIPTFKVQLCEPYEDKFVSPSSMYVVQPKLDGVRCIAICYEYGVELYTRNGSRIFGYDNIIDELSSNCFKGYVFDGEIMAQNFDKTMEGLFAKKEDKLATYTIFDCLNIQFFKEKRCPEKYIDRFQNLADILHGDYYQSIPENVSFLKSINYDVLSGSEILQSVSSLDKIARDGGYEGLVIKNASSFYEYKRSKSWLKYKAMKEDDFIITGFIEGKGKYEGTLGAIQVESKDGIIKSEVGTGFSDVQRDHIWENQEFFIDNLVKVKYQEVTKDFSLRFPSFIEIRNDL